MNIIYDSTPRIIVYEPLENLLLQSAAVPFGLRDL